MGKTYSGDMEIEYKAVKQLARVNQMVSTSTWVMLPRLDLLGKYSLLLSMTSQEIVEGAC